MVKRQIGHRRSCSVLSALFPVVNEPSCYVAKSVYLLLWCCFYPSFSSFLPVWRGSCLLALSLQWYSHCLVGWLVWRLPAYAKPTGCSSNQSHNEPRENQTELERNGGVYGEGRLRGVRGIKAGRTAKDDFVICLG